jgi:phosphatidylserine/phosphatidylglycerophosphate/cardiolipin synthase-like enzyme
MHHKVIVVDGEIVIFGSFNFSASANDSNDENLLIVYDPVFAGAFLEEFEKVWAQAKQG